MLEAVDAVRVDKVYDSPEAAVADVADGSHVAVAGFGVTHKFPSSLILALRDQGARELTVYCNGLGQPGHPTAQVLAENHQLARLVASFSTRPGPAAPAELQILSGDLDVELVPQGTLVERMRAGGAGIAAFYTPTGVGTEIGVGKEVREFDGQRYLLERGIRTDYALLRAYRADRMGNVQFRGASRNFNDSFAKAARIAIVEVDEIVEAGELAPEDIDLPGVFISRVVRSTVHLDIKTLPHRAERPSSTGRQYVGKSALTRSEMAHRAALLLRPGSVVNLGAGLPTQITNFMAGRDITLHGENGILNYGVFTSVEERDPDVHDSGGNFVTLNPGASFFDSVTSFEIARSGRLDTVVLGAYQVSAHGDLANWALPGTGLGGIGGAMDLAVGAQHVIALLEHLDSKGNQKLVQTCDYPLTAAGCVDSIVTDLAVFSLQADGFRLDEIARGFTVDEVLELTGMNVTVAESVAIMQDSW